MDREKTEVSRFHRRSIIAGQCPRTSTVPAIATAALHMGSTLRAAFPGHRLRIVGKFRQVRISSMAPTRPIRMILNSASTATSLRRTIPVGLFVGTLLLVGATLTDYGIAWDEPAYFHAADLHIAWVAELGKNVVQHNAHQSLTDET